MKINQRYFPLRNCVIFFNVRKGIYKKIKIYYKLITVLFKQLLGKVLLQKAAPPLFYFSFATLFLHFSSPFSVPCSLLLFNFSESDLPQYTDVLTSALTSIYRSPSGINTWPCLWPLHWSSLRISAPTSSPSHLPLSKSGTIKCTIPHPISTPRSHLHLFKS